jgi:hypothetical protein
MMSMSTPRTASGATPYGWRELEEQVRAFLDEEGLPAGEASRISRAVIRICAEAAESLDRDRLRHAAWEETRALLENWQAARRELLLARV